VWFIQHCSWPPGLQKTACWESKNLTHNHKAYHTGLCLIHLTCYADQGYQFLQFCVNGGWNMSYSYDTQNHKARWWENTHYFTQYRNSKQSYWWERTWQLSFGAIKVCFLWCSGLWWCCNCSAVLCYTWGVVAGLLSQKAWLVCQL